MYEKFSIKVEDGNRLNGKKSYKNLPHGPAAFQSEAFSEIEEDLVTRHQRKHLFPRAVLVGLETGLFAAFFRAVLTGADALRNILVIWSQQFVHWRWLFPMLFSMTGDILSVLLVIHYAPETSGSGIPHLKAVLHRLQILKGILSPGSP